MYCVLFVDIFGNKFAVSNEKAAAVSASCVLWNLDDEYPLGPGKPNWG